MGWLGTSSHSLIGVDIGTTSIKLVQLRRGRGGCWALGHALKLSRGDASTFDLSEATRLADVLERQGFKGRNLIVAAPASALLVDVLDLPPRESGAPIERLAAEEVARSHKLVADEFCLAVWDLPAGQRGSAGASAMSVSLRHQDSDALLDPLESVGLCVSAIDAPAAALARACADPASSGVIRAILDIGQSAATLMLVVDQSVIYQRRLLEGGLANLFGTLERDFGLGGDAAQLLLQDLGVGSGTGHGPSASRVRGMILRHVESLNDEIEAGLQYARHRHPGLPFGELLIAGGGAAIKGIDVLLGSRLSVASRPLIPPVLGTDPTHAIFAQACGLAMYGVA